MENKIGYINADVVKNNLIDLKNIVFEVTEKCNLRCKYCGLSERLYEKHSVRDQRDLTFKKVKLLIDHLANLWEENYISDTNRFLIISFYGGEPLINMPLIKEIINYIENKNIKGKEIHYAMTTNAMLLDQYMDYLVEKKFNLAISLDGDETSQSYRVDHAGFNSYSRVIRNVKLLQQRYPAYFSKEEVVFVSVLHNRNDVEPLLKFFKSNFDKTPIILPLSTTAISEEKKEEFKSMYQNKFQSLIKSSNCESIEEKYFLEMPRGLQLSHYIYDSSGNIFYNYNQLLMQKYGENIISTGTCTPFSKKLFLAVDGKILPCERIDHDFELGYVHEDSVELDYKYVADKHNYFLSKMSKQCCSCAIRSYCYQCMYHVDDIRNESIHCPSFYTPELAEQEREQNFSYLKKHPHYYKRILNDISFSL